MNVVGKKFSMICDKLKDIRDKFFQKLTDIVPLFSIFSDLEKFFFIFRSNVYDINMCYIKGISEMYKYRNSLMQFVLRARKTIIFLVLCTLYQTSSVEILY